MDIVGLFLSTSVGCSYPYCERIGFRQKVAAAAKEISRDTRRHTLEKFHADYMAKLEPEVNKLKKIFDVAMKGLNDFSQ